MRLPRRHIPIVLVTVLAACGGGPQASVSPSSSIGPTSEPSGTETSRPTPTLMPSAGPIDPSMLGDLTAETDIPFTGAVTCRDASCTVPLDIISPADGQALPTFVVLPGGPVPFAERRYMLELSIALAERDAVVFLATYRNPTTGNDEEDSLADVACAVRFARTETAAHGGNPERVILVGHSRGGDLTLETALAPTDADGCLADGSAAPDVAVPLAGFAADVPDAPEAPPILLVSGSADPASNVGPGLAEELRAAGVEAEYRELVGIDHPTIVEPDRAGIVDILMEAVDLAG